MSDQSGSVETKLCKKCGEVKPLDEFYHHPSTRDRRQSHCKPCMIETADAWAKANPVKKLFMNARARAKKFGIPFELRMEDIVIPETCPCCEEKLEQGSATGQLSSPSFDQIIPRLGYTVKNTIIICYDCNRKKNNSTPEEMYHIADFVYRIRKERGLDQDVREMPEDAA